MKMNEMGVKMKMNTMKMHNCFIFKSIIVEMYYISTIMLLKIMQGVAIKTFLFGTMK